MNSVFVTLSTLNLTILQNTLYNVLHLNCTSDSLGPIVSFQLHFLTKSSVIVYLLDKSYKSKPTFVYFKQFFTSSFVIM